MGSIVTTIWHLQKFILVYFTIIAQLLKKQSVLAKLKTRLYSPRDETQMFHQESSNLES